MALADARTHVDTALTRESLRGMSNENTFAGITSFLRRRYTKDLSGVDVAVTGIPYDGSLKQHTGCNDLARDQSIQQSCHRTHVTRNGSTVALV